MYTPALISIDGNIGSGKSTLLRKLRERNLDWHFIDEPVESWMALKNEAGESLLELFYKDKRRWAYTFQNTALLTRILNMKDAITKWQAAGRPGRPIFITERCVDTDAKVFAKIMLEDKDIDRLEWDLYRKWYDNFAWMAPSPVGYIHVDTPVDVCVKRIAERAREGEDRIPEEYLKKLDGAHQDWLKGGNIKVPVMRYNNYSSEGQTTVEDVEKWVVQAWLESID
jgi:deoxyadenosine/deoxycytidine kinase